MANPQPNIIELRFLSWGDLGSRSCRYKMFPRGCRVNFTGDGISMAEDMLNKETHDYDN